MIEALCPDSVAVDADDDLDEFSGRSPREWMDGNWRRYVWHPGRLPYFPRAEPADIGGAGLYFLWGDDGGLNYIGLSKDVSTRILQHAKGGVPFDGFSVILVKGPLTRDLFLSSIEAAYIEALRPPLNRKLEFGPWRGTSRMARVIKRVWRSSLGPATPATAPAKMRHAAP